MSSTTGRISLRNMFFLIGLVAVYPQVVVSGDWSGWRGPDHSGVSSGNGVFANEPFALEIAWSRPLGIAYSGISVVDGRLVTMFADGESDYLVALDAASGKEIWRYGFAGMFPPRGGSEGGSLSVPVIDEGIVYGLGAEGHLFAVRLADGSPVWSLRVGERFGARIPHFGFATTPLVFDDLLIVETGGTEGRALVALNKKTGDLVWSTGDDSVSYQSPITVTLAGQRQLVAATDRFVMGLAPDSGRVLWNHPHGIDDRSGFATPVIVGNDRVLLPGRQETAAFRVTATDHGFDVEELWRNSYFKLTFATPVYHEDHVYGFSGDFLTCISAETGEKVWRSRPPGGQGLIVVDGHLVILGAEGELVVARASPSGYDERARVAVFDRTSPTYPSFAGGMFFVRDTRMIAGIRVAKGASAVADRDTAPPAGEFATFVHRVEQSDDKKKVIDDFMSAQERFPIIEGDRLVHFVYRGDVDDVAVTGSMTELHVEEPLQRIDGTDFFHGSYPIEPGARWEYRFNVDFENLQPDPLNPRRVAAEDGERSELVMPGWVEPEYLRPFAGSNPGRVERFELESKILGETRRARVYLPPGYDAGNGSYPVVILNDGRAWLDLADLPNSLNNLIGRKIAPIIAVFVELPRRAALDEFGGARSADHIRMIADELVPHLDRHYRTVRAPEARAILGAGNGATMAVFAGIERPEVFGKSGGCSFQLIEPLGSVLMATIERGLRSPSARFQVVWSRYELRSTRWGLDFGEDSRRLFDALKASGLQVRGGEVLDAAGWGGWRAQVTDIVASFFPR